MKRFVTYLYEYERGIKTRSAGFIKVDIRNGMVNMEICVRKFLKNVTNGMVYALVTKNGLYGIKLGEIGIYGGQGDLRMQMQEGDIAGKGIFIEDMAGVGIQFGEQGYIASCWKDAYAQEIGDGAFSFYDGVTKNADCFGKKMQGITRTGAAENEVAEDEGMDSGFAKNEDAGSGFVEDENKSLGLVKNEDAGRTFVEDENRFRSFEKTKIAEKESLEMENIAADNAYAEQTVKDMSEMQAAEWGQHVQMSVEDIVENAMTGMKQTEDICGSCCMEKQYVYKKMDLTHTRELPPPDRHYGSNAFLIHGFWNYGYLIHKEEVAGDQKTVSLGVPGVYERQEAAMAMAFGFPKFETFPMEMMDEMFLKERSFSEKEINGQSPKTRLFGCWFVELHT